MSSGSGQGISPGVAVAGVWHTSVPVWCRGFAAVALLLLAGCQVGKDVRIDYSQSTGGSGSTGGPSDPAFWRTTEYLASGDSYDRINLAGAYAARTTGEAGGKGVSIAIIDTGFSLDIGELDAGSEVVSTVEGVDYTARSHGTAVAVIAAGRRNGTGMHGVAHEATLKGFQVTTGNFIRLADAGVAVASAAGLSTSPITGRDIISGMRTDIINISFGGFAYEPYREIITRSAKSSYARKTVFVMAVGNDGTSDPEYPARYVADAECTDSSDYCHGGLAIAVVAIDPSDESDYPSRDNGEGIVSAACGSVREWCLAAPGINIPVTLADGSVGTGSGTSYAAPMVSGAVAWLMAAFPGISSEAIVRRLLDSASDIGDEGVDEIYGHGLLDLEAALSAVGALTVGGVDGAGNYVTLGDPGQARLTGGVGWGDIAGNSGLLSRIIALDSEGFPYRASLGERFRAYEGTSPLSAWLAPEGTGAGNVQGAFGPVTAMVSFSSPETTAPAGQPEQLAHRFGPGLFLRQAAVDGGATGGKRRPTGWHISSQIDGIGHVTFFSGGHAGMSPGGELIRESAGTASFRTPLAFASDPYGALVADGRGVSVTTQLSGSWRSSVLAAEGQGILSDSTLPTRLVRVDNRYEVSPALSLFGSVGQLTETGGFNGGSGEGALACCGRSRTTLVSLGFRYQLAEPLVLDGVWTTGRTSISGQTNSVLRDFSSLSSRAMAVSLTWRLPGDRGDSLYLGLAQPLRIVRGTATVSGITGVDYGAYITEQERISLAPGTGERALTLGYTVEQGRWGRISVAGFYRRHPGHSRSNRDEGSVGLRWSLAL